MLWWGHFKTLLPNPMPGDGIPRQGRLGKTQVFRICWHNYGLPSPRVSGRQYRGRRGPRLFHNNNVSLWIYSIDYKVLAGPGSGQSEQGRGAAPLLKSDNHFGNRVSLQDRMQDLRSHWAPCGVFLPVPLCPSCSRGQRVILYSCRPRKVRAINHGHSAMSGGGIGSAPRFWGGCTPGCIIASKDCESI